MKPKNDFCKKEIRHIANTLTHHVCEAMREDKVSHVQLRCIKTWLENKTSFLQLSFRLTCYPNLERIYMHIYIFNLHCHTHFGNHVTKYDVKISKKGLPKYNFFCSRCRFGNDVSQKEMVDITMIMCEHKIKF